jgi:putative spermidine/putrescine transport system ATP-binding protein
MSAPILELRNLSKAYSTLRSVDGVSTTLGQGEFMSFLGPSGSGKTTTLGMIAGLVEPSGGDILLQSRSIRGLPPYRRNIGVVFQNYALFPHMSVAANVAFPLEMRRVAKAEARDRVIRALEMVELGHLRDRLPAALSGGQQQRVALARAMVFEPPLLLMDEPLGALDKRLREQMQMEIRHLHERLGISVIYVTHDQDEALTMSDRIAVFNNGRIEQIGAPDELYDRPATLFVAGFVGETNLVPGRVGDADRTSCKVAAGGIEHVAGAPPAGFGRGGHDTLANRPARIESVGEGEALPAGRTVLDATVVETIYLGRFRRYVVAAGDATLSVVRQVRGPEEAGFNPSDRVRIGWDPASVAVLASEQAKQAV